MHTVENGAVSAEQARLGDWDTAFAGVLTDRRRRGARENQAAPPRRCVSAGYLADSRSCRASVPCEVVQAAWGRQLEGGSPEGFFRFAWQDEVWLGYGLKDGEVRGVYCPAHSAERDRRVHSARTAVPPPAPGV